MQRFGGASIGGPEVVWDTDATRFYFSEDGGKTFHETDSGGSGRFFHNAFRTSFTSPVVGDHSIRYGDVDAGTVPFPDQLTVDDVVLQRCVGLGGFSKDAVVKIPDVRRPIGLYLIGFNEYIYVDDLTRSSDMRVFIGNKRGVLRRLRIELAEQSMNGDVELTTSEGELTWPGCFDDTPPRWKGSIIVPKDPASCTVVEGLIVGGRGPTALAEGRTPEYLFLIDDNELLYVDRDPDWHFRLFVGARGAPMRQIEVTDFRRAKDGGSTWITTPEGELFSPAARRDVMPKWKDRPIVPKDPGAYSIHEGAFMR